MGRRRTAKLIRFGAPLTADCSNCSSLCLLEGRLTTRKHLAATAPTETHESDGYLSLSLSLCRRCREWRCHTAAAAACPCQMDIETTGTTDRPEECRQRGAALTRASGAIKAPPVTMRSSGGTCGSMEQSGRVRCSRIRREQSHLTAPARAPLWPDTQRRPQTQRDMFRSQT